jgi:hypothetical protein
MIDTREKLIEHCENSIVPSSRSMVNITVGRITRDPIDPSRQIRIDRMTVMGNPFYLPSEASDEEREFNLKMYRLYLDGILRKAYDPRTIAHRLAESYEFTIPNTWQRPSLKTFRDEFDRLVSLSLKQPIQLMCFCHPKRCHGDILKSAIEWQIRETFSSD